MSVGGMSQQQEELSGVSNEWRWDLEAQRLLTDEDRCQEKLGAQQSGERHSCVWTGSVLHQQDAQCLRIDSRATVPRELRL